MISSNTGAFSICSGNDITLSVQETAGVTYQWFKDEVAINTGISNALDINMGAVYSLQFINSFCSRTTSAIDVVETETPAPVISTDGFLFFCDNDSVKITTNIETDVNYQLIVDNVDIAGSNDPENLYANQAGDFQVKADRNGCIALSNVLSALVQPSPEIPEVSSPVLGELTATLSNSYQWFKDGLELSGETMQLLSVSKTGNYVVKVGDENAFCFAESEPFNAGFDVVGLFNDNESSKLLLYPSVTSSTIHLNYSVNGFTIVDSKGNVVVKSNEELNQIDVSDLPIGLYQFVSEFGTTKFIKK